MSATATIERYLDVMDVAKLDAELDQIFFEASNTKSFASESDRETFRERWLGRYLKHDAALAFIAVDTSRSIAGYVVGAADDPGQSRRFDDVGYFADFRDLTARYPAHLHVNLAPAFRNQGIGGQLIGAFIAEAKRQGAHGAHVVTSANARNVRFYSRNGFREEGRLCRDGREIVFLARTI